MEKWAKKTAVVAGANSGMGAALTRRFLENDMQVFALDKNVDFLNELKNDEEYSENLTVLEADVLSDDDISSSVKIMSENSDQVNIVVYSIGQVGSNNLIDGEFTEWQNLINLNVVSFCSCMREIVNLMLKQNVKDGHIIVMNSIVSLETNVFPELHFYAATKCAMESITEGLRHEIKEKKSPIKVTSIIAGLVKTDLYKNSIGSTETPIYKTLVSLSVDDVTEAVEYILRSSSGVVINKLVICPRGIFKQNLFQMGMQGMQGMQQNM